MRYSLAGLLILACAGCGEFQDALEGERQPATPPGIAPVDDTDGLSTNGGNNAAGDNGGQANANGTDKSSIIGKTDAKVVDKKKAMAENPNLVIVENKVSGNDLVSVAGSAYISATSRISVATFKHNLDLWKSLPENNGRNPTYEEFKVMAKELQFSRLPPYQMYGYDEDTGGIVILEDKADKKRRYEAAGIPLDE